MRKISTCSINSKMSSMTSSSTGTRFSCQRLSQAEKTLSQASLFFASQWVSRMKNKKNTNSETVWSFQNWLFAKLLRRLQTLRVMLLPNHRWMLSSRIWVIPEAVYSKNTCHLDCQEKITQLTSVTIMILIEEVPERDLVSQDITQMLITNSWK